MSRKKGDEAENLACKYLEAHGFCVVCRNFYTRFGEIDIVATKDEIYHFVEVKSADSGEPLLKVTPKKLEKIYKSIALYLDKHALDVAYCVDVVAIKRGEIELYANVSV